MHNFVIFMILVKNTPYKMVAMVTSEVHKITYLYFFDNQEVETKSQKV